MAGITAKYNGTAPLLFAAGSEEFIPLSKRPFRNAPYMERRLDLRRKSSLILSSPISSRRSIQEYWKIVADIFRERTGEHVDYVTIGRRYSQL